MECRFHPSEKPILNELVISEVLKINDKEVTVRLPEYNNIEATMDLKELARKRIKSIRRVIKVKEIHVLSVINIDPDTGHISLSKKHVTEQESEKILKKHNQLKRIHSIISKTAQELNCPTIEIYQNFLWKLPYYNQSKTDSEDLESNKNNDLFTHLKELYQSGGNMIPQPYTDIFSKHLEYLFKPVKVIIAVQFHLQCLSDQGIDGIKSALIAGKKAGNNENQSVKITIEGAPLYKISVETYDNLLDQTASQIVKTLETISETIKHNGGHLVKIPDSDHGLKIEPEYFTSTLIEKINPKIFS